MKIVTDSGADLFFPPETLKKIDVKTIPLNVSLDDNVYREDIDINAGEFYYLLKNTKNLPTTSPPSIVDFVNTYRTISMTDPNILSVHISSNLSETYKFAKQGAQLVPEANIIHFDAKTLSAVVGWMIEAASRAIEAGWSNKMIINLMRKISAESNTVYTLEELRYLINGGRISHMKGLIANVLGIKPVIGIEKKDGSFIQHGQERSFKGALNGLLKYMKSHHEFGSRLRVQVLHSYSHEKAAAFKYQIDKYYDVVWLPIGEMSLVLGAHTGPSMVGVAFADQKIFDALP